MSEGTPMTPLTDHLCKLFSDWWHTPNRPTFDSMLRMDDTLAAAEQETARLRAELAAAREQLTVLRRLLWLNHGHWRFYGDDGEMQCKDCGIDFKRIDPAELEQRWIEAGIKRAALAPASEPAKEEKP